MKHNRIYRVVLLEGSALARIDARPGLRIIGVRGTLWITQEGDLRDWIVGQGQSVVFDRPGRLVVNAIAGEAAFGHDASAEEVAIGKQVSRPASTGHPLWRALERIRPRRSPTDYARIAPGPRRTLVEAEARWMRSRVVHAVLAHAGNAIGATLRGAVSRVAAMLSRRSTG